MKKPMTTAMVLGGGLLLLEACGGPAPSIGGGHGGGAGTDAGAAGAGGTAGGGGAPTGPPIHAKEVAIGAFHACALSEDETVVCWQQVPVRTTGAASPVWLGQPWCPDLPA